MIHPRTLRSLEFDRIRERLASLCHSETGRARALACAPLPDAGAVAEAQHLYDEVATWAARPVDGLSVDSLPGEFPDVTGMFDAIAARGPRAVEDTDSFWALRTVMVLAKKVVDAVCVPGAEETWPRLAALATNPPLPEQLTSALVRCIGDDGNIRDEASPELYQVRSEMRRLHQTCLRKVHTFAEENGVLPYLQDEYLTVSSDRYVMPFKATYKTRVQGIIHDWSQTGETCYFEPIFLVDLNNSLQELRREEHEAESQVLSYLANLLDAALPGARAAVNLLTELDFLAAKRHLAAATCGRCIPLCTTGEGISLMGARHPLLLLAEVDAARRDPNLRRGESSVSRAQKKVHALDITLRPGERALIVTGGNAGGKTVCLKTLGLCTVMTLSGLPVPAAPGSQLPWFSRVDAFIGDEQSLESSVSTFTAQIRHLAKAWKHFDGQALVLLDEFGAGTDPSQGAALAQGVLDELIDRDTFVLTATHFPALKGYALTRDRARAASMLFDPATHKPLYALAYDQVGASQALDVARENGLPEAILRRAQHYLLQDGEDTTALLARLNDLAAVRAEEIRTLKAEQKKAEETAKRCRERLEEDRAKLYGEVREKAQELMRAWKAERVTHKQALKEMSSIRAGLARDGMAEDAQTVVLPTPEVLHVGDSVMHTVFRRKGTITEVDTKKKRVRLDLGGVGLWADMKDIREYVQAQEKAQAEQEKTRTAKTFGRIDPVLARQQEARKEESRPEADGASQSAKHAAQAAFSVDVRGLRADSAITEVQACIDKAWLAEFREVEIIHGRGTGALRRAIHAWLATCSAVEAYSVAPADRGGDGMTIVTLRS